MNADYIIQEDHGKSGIQNNYEISFWQFIKQKDNLRFLRIGLNAIIIQFIIFKGLYPFADFFSDSYSYIYAAQANLDVSIWPIGYSKFLRAFHFITDSDTALVSFQYFFLELSAFYFFFTTLYFYRLVKSNRVILFIFLFFNPLFLYICNYVNSDPIFIALSLFWFTELIWILHQPNVYHIVVQGLLLFACFTVRNNAYIYPLITIVAFALSRLRLWMKISGSALGLLLIIPFIIHTRNVAYKMTGTKMFSFFTGWQLANNALYIYEYADTAKNLSSQVLELDKLSTRFYGSVPPGFWNDRLASNPGNFFIQFRYSPLKLYMDTHYKIKDEYSSIIAWGKCSVLFEDFGQYIITHNKNAFLHQFILPNTKNYFLPYLEKLDIYNLGDNTVWPIAKDWFHYKSVRIRSVSAKAQGYILCLFPAFFLAINLYLIGYTIALWMREKHKHLAPNLRSTQLLVLSFWLANFCFCVFATIIVLRYEVVPMIICMFGSLLITEWIEKKEVQKHAEIYPTEKEEKELLSAQLLSQK